MNRKSPLAQVNEEGDTLKSILSISTEREKIILETLQSIQSLLIVRNQFASLTFLKEVLRANLAKTVEELCFICILIGGFTGSMMERSKIKELLEESMNGTKAD